MASMTLTKRSKTAPVCPRCEFSHRTAGQPRAAGPGLWHCGDCGARWRDIVEGADGKLTPVGSTVAEPIFSEPPDVLPDMLAMLRPGRSAGRREYRTRTAFRPWNAIVGGVAVIAVLVGGWQAASIASAMVSKTPVARAASQLTLSEVHSQKLLRGGRIALRVEGRITNHTGQRQALSPVEIVAMADKGGEVGRWLHVPATGHIEPGQTIRFSTASGDIGGKPDRIEIRFAGLTTNSGI